MNKVLIVGSGPGLAFSTARRFARDGWRVVLLARNEERLREQVASLQGEGAEASYHRCDVTDFAALDRLVRQESEDGGIDLLNYNAAVIRPQTPLLDASIDDIRSDLLADIGGALVAARAAIPGMGERGRGTMIFSGGDLAHNPWYSMLTLGVGKAGMRNAVGALNQDPACAGLRIVYVNIAAHITGPVGDEIAEVYHEIYHQPQMDDGWEVSFSRPYGEG
jgi:NAD(P)-dependent dehydrogenase (short-subunit alcohol dehydrogenase family)